eukprot:3051808-Pyramimonas_sp.AAC.1
MIPRILDNDPQPRSKRIPRTFFVQLYRTESCQYLLPTGRFEKGSLAEQIKLRKTVMRYFYEVLRTSVGHNKHVKQRPKSMDAGSLTLVPLSSGQEGESGPDHVSDSDMEITNGSDRNNSARQLAVPVEPPAMLSTSTSPSVPTQAILDEIHGQPSQARDNSLYVPDSPVLPSHCGEKET